MCDLLRLTDRTRVKAGFKNVQNFEKVSVWEVHFQQRGVYHRGPAACMRTKVWAGLTVENKRACCYLQAAAIWGTFLDEMWHLTYYFICKKVIHHLYLLSLRRYKRLVVCLVALSLCLRQYLVHLAPVIFSPKYEFSVNVKARKKWTAKKVVVSERTNSWRHERTNIIHKLLELVVDGEKKSKTRREGQRTSSTVSLPRQQRRDYS